MPTAKTLQYDHPAYQIPQTFFGQTAVGAAGVSPKFAAFTAMQIRSVVTVPNIASTAAGSQPLMYVKSGTATSTTTLTVLTSAATAVLTNVLATAVTLADATASLSLGIEMYPVPGAALACP
jgi:hypothetical protein